jgi:hypothetical protein
MMSDLKPCPFCGSEANWDMDPCDEYDPETGEGDEGLIILECSNKKCGISFEGYMNTVFDKWDSRVEAPPTIKDY